MGFEWSNRWRCTSTSHHLERINSDNRPQWINITWPMAYNISYVALYDRPNANDWIQGGVLSFDDGSTTAVDVLNNDGTATLFTMPAPIVSKSILFTVNAVASTTSSAGLAEFQVYGMACPSCTIGNTSVTTVGTDLAMLGTATASSYAMADQAPSKAIDGVATGYPGDYTKEWSSNGETVGAWLTVTWPRTYSIDSVILYDRPNLNDWITGGQLSFSDGSAITGSLLPSCALRYLS
jgi:hypothetical protein